MTTYTAIIPQIGKAKQMVASLDEWHLEKIQGRYPKFEEMPITFDPTYKRDPWLQGLHFVNKKNQAPSYTDRIFARLNCPVS